ncbi:serine/threonine kinase [Caulobacter sp. Root487D2Y]|uniref:PASTA domain-containing protein n=1 Tax=Caulobacter sp. Root487D2Y TaxID=1736547 RepID=UPI0006F7778A|nr:PASTA domain-containing protein [Caulobacter sp. Root487D2Y]KQY30825.1 serine/threonine kinase [Caulobacter sp. Root487D2Y]
MPSFEIPDGPTTVALKKEGGFHKGNAVFGVTNKTEEGLTARFSVQVQGDGKPEWYQVQGEPERPVAAGENQTVTVVAKIPAATPAGQHRIKLRVTNVNDPDNDSTDSTAATVTVPAAGPAAPPVKKPFPWWILAVAGGVLVLVIGVIIAIVAMSGGSKVPDVVGQPYAEAVKALDKAGYTAVKRADKEAGDKPPETVLDQSPAAKTKAKKTDTILLTVAAPAPVVKEEPKEEPKEEMVEIPAEANCDPAVGACIDGFVWRDAGANDRVCVTPESRYLAALENRQAGARRNPNGGPYGPDTCLMGYVWRDGFANDHVCVSGERRTVVAQENAAGPSRSRACRPSMIVPKSKLNSPAG